MEQTRELRVHVKAVGERDGRPYVILGTRTRWVPIFVGESEARAIGMVTGPDSYEQAVTEEGETRPMTADLVLAVADVAGLEVEKLVVTEVRSRVFMGELHLSDNGGTAVLDCRPSDGIAVALRARAPIYVTELVMQQASTSREAAERWLAQAPGREDASG